MSRLGIFILQPAPHPSRMKCLQFLNACPDGAIVEIRAPTRTLKQNAKMWAMLHEISIQVDWYGNKLTDNEWKDVFSASLKQQRVVPGIEGGFVVCGQSTSKMSTKELNEMIELMHAFGADPNHLVDFNDIEDIEPMGRMV